MVLFLPQPVGPAQHNIISKLDRIRLQELGPWDDIPLSQVVQQLSTQAKRLDPKGKGVNFLINSNSITSATSSSAPPQIGETTGLRVSNAEALSPLNIGSASITIDPALADIRLADALDAICAVADRPIHWSLEDHGVLFSPKSPDRHAARLELVIRPGMRLTLSWSVYRNGVLHSASSRTRTYVASEVAATNLISLGFAHGNIVGIPGGPIAVERPTKGTSFTVTHWLGDVVGQGWIPASHGQFTLIELAWDNGGDYGMNHYGFATRRGRVILEAKAEALRQAPGGRTDARQDRRFEIPSSSAWIFFGNLREGSPSFFKLGSCSVLPVWLGFGMALGPSG